MTNRARRLAELSMMVAIPIITRANENSKLDGMLRKMHDIALGQLRRMSAKQSDMERTTIRLKIWAERSGWLGNTGHDAAIRSFGLGLLKRSPEDYGVAIDQLIYKLSAHMKQINILLTMEQCGGQEAIDDWEEQYAIKPIGGVANESCNEISIH